jgi:hypothetical protein
LQDSKFKRKSTSRKSKVSKRSNSFSASTPNKGKSNKISLHCKYYPRFDNHSAKDCSYGKSSLKNKAKGNSGEIAQKNNKKP